MQNPFTNPAFSMAALTAALLCNAQFWMLY